ncbi:MAG: hypothetical protein IEMM0008_0406 [bacterium]|nr:MAG: hypothetical protein IEMM0008_0406 [bacterium]
MRRGLKNAMKYVSNEAENSISVIKLSNFKVVAKIRTKKKPHNVRFNKRGSRAYVTLQGGAGLGVINTRKRKMIKVGESEKAD